MGGWIYADMTVAEAGLSNKKKSPCTGASCIIASASARTQTQTTNEQEEAATAAGMGEARDKLHAALVTFYKTHNPSKVKIVRKIIDLYMKKHNGDMDVARSAIFTDIKKTYNAIP